MSLSLNNNNNNNVSKTNLKFDTNISRKFNFKVARNLKLLQRFFKEIFGGSLNIGNRNYFYINEIKNLVIYYYI